MQSGHNKGTTGEDVKANTVEENLIHGICYLSKIEFPFPHGSSDDGVSLNYL